MVSTECLLLVEDDDRIRRSLARSLAERYEIAVTEDVASAKQQIQVMEKLDVVLFDYQLPDGTGLQIAEAAVLRSPIPILVAMSGAASTEDTFLLGRSGVVRFIQKPCTAAELAAVISEAKGEPPPELRPAIAAHVGATSLPVMQNELRRTMLDEALARSSQSRSGAARLLGVSRQRVQKMLHPKPE